MGQVWVGSVALGKKVPPGTFGREMESEVLGPFSQQTLSFAPQTECLGTT